MKKFLPVLMLALVTMLFSSCIIFLNEDDEDESTYSVTLSNDTTNVDFADWYLKNDSGRTFAKDYNHDVPVDAGERSKLRDLKKDYYYLVFRVGSSEYHETSRFYLNEDKTFSIIGVDGYGSSGRRR